MAHVDVNGVSYHYIIEGKPGAPWITFSHALANNLSLWDDIAEALSDRYQILRFDHPGHGNTPAVPGPYSFDMLIDNAIGLWDALGIEASHWVGLSIGGMMGYGLAAGYPGRVLSFTSCDARPDAPPDYADYFQYRIETARDFGMAGLVEPTVERWFTKASLEQNTPALDKVREMIRATDPTGHEGCCEALKQLSFGKILGDINVPTLILGGAEDKGAPVDVLAETAAQIPGARHVVIPGAGHITALEAPDAFQKILEKFLAEI
ncbi:MAG: alpha/beta fold hydrolase [Rhodospirillales bacterium]|nr:alpha/beta fold hydrolase [Rhodospirillales bacterium]